MPTPLAALLNDCLHGSTWLRVARALLQPRGHDLDPQLPSRPAPGHLLAQALTEAEVPVADIVDELRRCAPQELPAIDAFDEAARPREDRLGRVRPVAPTLRAFLGRQADIERIMAAAKLLQDSSLHVVMPTGSGRTALSARLAVDLADHWPVVWWGTGATPEARDAALFSFAVALGLGKLNRADQRQTALRWLSTNNDWCVILDDCTDPSPWPKTGRVITLSGPDAPEGAEQVHPLPPAQRNAVARVWSRRRAADGPGTLAQLVAHAADTRTSDAAAEADADALHAILAVLPPAPVPAAFLRAPTAEREPPEHVWLRSRARVAGAARHLVQRGRALWADDALLAVPSLLPRPARALRPVVAERLLLALAAAPEHLDALLPHLTWLADHPELDPHLRRTLAERAGRALIVAGDPAAAVDLLQRALASIPEDDPQQTTLQAGLLNDLGVAWRRLGRLDNARQALEDALALDDHAMFHDPLATAATWHNLGLVCIEPAPDRALHAFEQALNLRRTHLELPHPDLAATLIQVGHLAPSADTFAEAVAQLTAPGRARTRHDLLAPALQGLARCLAAQGHIAEAVKRGDHAARSLTKHHPDPDHPAHAAWRAQLTEWDDLL